MFEVVEEDEPEDGGSRSKAVLVYDSNTSPTPSPSPSPNPNPRPHPNQEWLRLEAEEALRLVRYVTGYDGSRAPKARTHTTLSARFPLLDAEYEVTVDAASLAAREYSKLPRQLGDALLRAVRSARDEADAVRNCEALVRKPYEFL